MTFLDTLFGDGEQVHASAVSRLRQPIYDEAVVTAMQIDAVYHVADHAMERAVELDNHRRQLAGSELQNQMLAELELVFFNKSRRLIHHMFELGW